MSYHIETNIPSDIKSRHIDQCVDLILSGGAVENESLREKFIKAYLIATVRHEDIIIGTGAIKQIREEYAQQISLRSGYPFPENTPELGYIAIHEDHREQGLSERIVENLLSVYDHPLFATTSSEQMKNTFKTAGFSERGTPWQGSSGRLTLWMRGFE